MYVYKSMQEEYAINHLKEFRKKPAGLAVRTSMINRGFFSVLIGAGDGNKESDFSNFAALFKSGDINGIRIYLENMMLRAGITMQIIQMSIIKFSPQ